MVYFSVTSRISWLNVIIISVISNAILVWTFLFIYKLIIAYICIKFVNLLCYAKNSQFRTAIYMYTFLFDL